MYMVTLALAGSYALAGNIRLSPARILRYLLVTAGLTVADSDGDRRALAVLGTGVYDKDRLVTQMKLLRPTAVRATVLRELPPEPLPLPRDGASLLDAIRERGRIRIGYLESAMPYSYFNAQGELVGLDIEMAYTLAAELGLEIDLCRCRAIAGGGGQWRSLRPGHVRYYRHHAARRRDGFLAALSG